MLEMAKKRSTNIPSNWYKLKSRKSVWHANINLTYVIRDMKMGNEKM